MDKVYIFFTDTLTGYSGGPSYVRNKKIWLENKGWSVFAFDWYSTKEGSNFSEFNDLKENRIIEFGFDPSWFLQSTRRRILNHVKSCVQYSSNGPKNIVIESNSFSTALWGEYIASELQAKHIIFLIGENLKLRSKQDLLFYQFKNSHDELFSISKPAFQLLFSNFLKLDLEETKYWNAMSIVEPQDIDFPEVENFRRADYTICHFGRYKMYVPSVVEGICEFSQRHLDKTINIIFFGCKSIPENLKIRFLDHENIKCYCIESRNPIPQKIFSISNVVIAAAGCATISFKSKSLTITMNVQSQKPLGVLGYTTIQNTYSNEQYPDSTYSLADLLEQALILKQFNYPPCLELESKSHGYDYQYSCISNVYNYYDVLRLHNNVVGLKNKMIKILFRFKLCFWVHKVRLYLFYHQK